MLPSPPIPPWKEPATYGKVFPGLFTGSLHGQPAPQLVFVFLIANSDPDGNTDAHPRAIASMTGLPILEVETALEVLMAPDPASRTPDEDGRRVEQVNPSLWHIVNYQKYRTMVDADTVRQQTKARVRAHREKKRSVTVGNGSLRQGEGEGEGEVKNQHPSSTAVDVLAASREAVRTTRLLLEQDFAEWYEAFPRHVAKLAAQKAYRAARQREGVTGPLLLAGAKTYATESVAREKDKIKHPATWLNAGCWADEAVVINGNGTSKEPWYGPADESDWARKRRWQKEGILG